MLRLEETVVSVYREDEETGLLRDWEWDPSTGFTESGKAVTALVVVHYSSDT